MVSKEGKAQVRRATEKAFRERDAAAAARKKKDSPKLGRGAAEKARQTVAGRKSQVDKAVKKAGG